MVKTSDYYPIGFFISILIAVGIFGSFKDIINGGILGLVTGLVVGLLSTFIVELSAGFAFSYYMLLGFGPVIFTIFGLIIGMISSALLRNKIKNTIDVEK